MSPFVDSGRLIESTFCTVDPFCWQYKKVAWYTSTDNMFVYWHEYQKDCGCGWRLWSCLAQQLCTPPNWPSENTAHGWKYLREKKIILFCMLQLFITEHENWVWKCAEGSLHVHIFGEYLNGNVKSDSLDKKTKDQIFIVHENPPFASVVYLKEQRCDSKRGQWPDLGQL